MRARLEIFDAVVAYISDGTARHGRETQTRDMSNAVLRQVGGETWEGVCFQSMVGSRGEGSPRVGADERIAANGLGGGGGLEEEGQVGLGMGGDLEVDGGGG